jgi:hypothetical protein
MNLQSSSCFTSAARTGLAATVEADLGEYAPLALFSAQGMVLRLHLEFGGLQQWFQMGAQEGHAVPLVGVSAQAHPDEVHVVRHQAIDRAEQTFACRGVEQQFAEEKVKVVSQPATRAIKGGERPVDDGVALIMLARQARKIKTAVERVTLWSSFLGHGIRASSRRLLLPDW